MIKDRATLEKLIDECGLSHRKADILAEVLPSIRLYLERVDDENTIPIGASKFGGLPDLPPESKWVERDGIVLNFVGQLRLEDVAAMDESKLLPDRGMLTFFYADNLNATGGGIWDLWRWSVLYHDDVAHLQRTMPPDNLVGHHTYHACRVGMQQELTLPSLWSLVMETRLGIVYTGEGSEGEKYDRLMEQVINGDEYRWFNQVGGHAHLIQAHDIFVESLAVAEQAHFKKPTPTEAQQMLADWTMLLQVDSDSNAGFMWGDMGLIYFCIQREALKQRRFDESVCSMVCH